MKPITEMMKERDAQEESIRQILNLQAGKDLLAYLEDEFYHGRIYDNDPHRTSYNLGARHVVEVLRQLKEGKTHG